MTRYGILLAMVAAVWAASPMADTPAKTTLVVAVDLSPKNLALSDPAFNDTVRDMVLAYADRLNMQYEDAVVMRAFAPPGTAARPLPEWHVALEFRYSKYGGKDPRTLRPFLAKRIAALIDVAPLGETDLHWSLKRLAREIDCSRDNVRVLLLSNLVEAGRFQDGKYYLAPIDAGMFKGCTSIAVAGFDASFVSGSAAALDVAEGAWEQTLKEAGFGNVEFLR